MNRPESWRHCGDGTSWCRKRGDSGYKHGRSAQQSKYSTLPKLTLLHGKLSNGSSESPRCRIEIVPGRRSLSSLGCPALRRQRPAIHQRLKRMRRLTRLVALERETMWSNEKLSATARLERVQRVIDEELGWAVQEARREGGDRGTR